MQAGDLRHRITIQRETLTSDSMGGNTSVWSTFATVYGAVWPLSGKEQIQNMQMQAEITHRVKIRWLSGVEPQMRILFGSRVLEIKSIINTEERNRELMLLCREVL